VKKEQTSEKEGRILGSSIGRSRRGEKAQESVQSAGKEKGKGEFPALKEYRQTGARLERIPARTNSMDE